MSYDVLINFIDANNEESILSTEYIKPKEVVFISEGNNNKVDKLEQYFKDKYPHIIFKCIQLHQNSVEDILKQYKDKSIIIDISLTSKYLSLQVLYLAGKSNIDVLYMDVSKREITIYNEEGITKKKVELVDIDIEDIMNTGYGDIIVESTNIGKAKIVEKLTMLISNNLETWDRIKQSLINTDIISHDVNNPYIINIDMNKLDKNDRVMYEKLITLLQQYQQIYIKKNDHILQIRFLNNFIKGFIFKTGSWFENFTKIIVEDIEFIDDVKSGVLFLWDENKRRIKNEIDVVAVKDGILICISCKDSCKYDENALNELNVYAHKLGGESVIKILAATKNPIKASVNDRAKAMDIDIIIFDGDKQQFKNKIRSSILQKIKY